MRYELSKQLPIPWQILAICAVGAVVGILSSVLPPFILIALLGAILYLLIVWVRPELALLAIVLLLATVFNENALPTFSVGFGHVLVSDLLLFIPLVILLLRIWVEPGFKLVQTPLDLPLLAFYAVAVLSTVLAITSGSIGFNQSLGEWRVVNLYLTFFIVTNLIRDKQRLRSLLNGLLVLSFVVAVLMIIQYFLGENTPILPGRVETLFTAQQGAAGVTRILPPGQSLVLLALITLTVLLIVERRRATILSRIVQLLTVAVAVALTFNRNFWIAAMVALVLAGILVSLPQKVRYVNMAVLVIVIVALLTVPARIVLGSEAQSFFEGLSTRFSTLLDPTTVDEGSLSKRGVENEYAIPQVLAHPVIGSGLGSDYRGWDRRIDFVAATWDRFAYVHDGHLWIMLKTGLVGYLFFIATLLVFIIRSLQNWKGVRDPYLSAIMLSFGVAMIGVLPATIVNPIFSQPFWAPLIGLMLGANEVIIRLNRQEAASALPATPVAKEL